MWGRLAALALGGGLLYGGGVGLRATLALRADAAGFAEVPATFTRRQPHLPMMRLQLPCQGDRLRI